MRLISWTLRSGSEHIATRRAFLKLLVSTIFCRFFMLFAAPFGNPFIQPSAAFGKTGIISKLFNRSGIRTNM